MLVYLIPVNFNIPLSLGHFSIIINNPKFLVDNQ